MNDATRSAAPIPFTAHLQAIGLSLPLIGLRAVRGPKGGPAMVLTTKGHGPVDLRAALPPGARVSVGGEVGVVEYSTRSHYVRLSAAQEHDAPEGLIAALVDMGASIEVG